MMYLSVIMRTVIRTQIQLTEDQARRLKRIATERGVSLATLIREGVDRVLAEEEARARRGRALSVARTSRFRSGVPDISREHDQYLPEAFAE
jgi:predicted DNA-binding protein